MNSIEAADVASRHAAVRTRIESLTRRFDHDVQIVAVTKGLAEDAIEYAHLSGVDAIGENYAQELISKRRAIERFSSEVHFIGRLQTNKVRQIAGLVSLWSSIDRTRLVDEVARVSPSASILIQVNLTGESSKGGCPPDQVATIVAHAVDAGLLVKGLMTVGPTNARAEAARPAFQQLRSLVDRLGLEVCSMGMSHDFAVAVEEGSTQVRLGTALFGPRPSTNQPGT